jgi:DNA segregation ATPase FtsK/SpoIIIE, S-DNA-T family
MTQITDEQLAIVAQITVKLATLGHELKYVPPISTGPFVTTYRFEPKGMAKVNQICSLSEDIALSLRVEDVLIRRIPGEAVIGITVPNKQRTLVLWQDTIVHVPNTSDNPLPLNFGVDSLGHPFTDDLTKCPHLLIAGSTDSGKSVLLRSLLATLVYLKTPEEVQLILSDTKQVEFGDFVGMRHLLFDPATTKYQTLERMDWISEEVERRLKVIARCGKQNILQYNQFSRLGSEEKSDLPKLPYIVLVIDELADIVGSGGEKGEKKIAEAKLSRIVQKSRAAGVHVLAATQRPSVDVISGSIKANFPARLSFRLPTETDSRTVLGHGGAEHLLSRGDMFYLSPSRPALARLHSSYASSEYLKGALTSVRMKHQMELNK